MFVAPGTVQQLVITLIVSLVVVNIFAHTEPYVADSSDFVAELSLWTIVYTLVWLLTTPFDETVLPDFVYTIGLFVFNSAVAVSSVFFCITILLKYGSRFIKVWNMVQGKRNRGKGDEDEDENGTMTNEFGTEDL